MSSTFERVALWNKLCGKDAPEIGTPEYYGALSNQAQRIREELEELEEAIKISGIISELMKSPDWDSSDIIKIDDKEYFVDQETLDHWNQEILDAGCDLDVVVSGCNFLSGHDYEGAINEVLGNNDVKYTLNYEVVEASIKADYSEETHEVVSSQFTGVDEDSGIEIPLIAFSIHRKADDKICKLSNHPKVDLSPFVNK